MDTCAADLPWTCAITYLLRVECSISTNVNSFWNFATFFERSCMCACAVVRVLQLKSNLFKVTTFSHLISNALVCLRQCHDHIQKKKMNLAGIAFASQRLQLHLEKERETSESFFEIE